jgi:hypothetical protein
MQIIISILIVGLLWMIYDLINAPELDENENPVSPEEAQELPKKKKTEKSEAKSEAETSEVE